MADRNEKKAKELVLDELEKAGGGKSIYRSEWRQICTQCGAVLDTETALAEHIRDKHSEEPVHLRF